MKMVPALTLVGLFIFGMGCERGGQPSPEAEQAEATQGQGDEGQQPANHQPDAHPTGEQPSAEPPLASPDVGTPSAEPQMVAVAAEGSRFDPPVQPEQIPPGSWYCNMGTVHYASQSAGDGSCPVCGMRLTQRAGGSAEGSAHPH